MTFPHSLIVGLMTASCAVLVATVRRRSVAPAKSRQDKPNAGPLDTSEANLRRVFGDANVRMAWDLLLEPVGTLLGLQNKFGGEPSFVGVEHWPRCQMCQLPMTFIGQVAVGPAHPIRYPTAGWLYVFLCNSIGPGDVPCQTSTQSAGGAKCFVQPGQLPAQVLGEPPEARAALATAVARNQTRTCGPGFFAGIERPSGARPYLAKQYDASAKHEQPTIQLPAKPSAEQYALAAAVPASFAVHVGGGFPDWVQDPEEITCVCGGQTEFVMQFCAFDDVINLGDSGEAYVFACRNRCAASSFYLFWQGC